MTTPPNFRVADRSCSKCAHCVQKELLGTKEEYCTYYELYVSVGMVCDDWAHKESELEELILSGLYTDGAHHKQYYLERLADLFEIEHTIYAGHDESISP